MKEDIKKTAYSLRNTFLKKNISLVYEGQIDHATTKAFADLIVKRLESEEKSFVIKKRLLTCPL